MPTENEGPVGGESGPATPLVSGAGLRRLAVRGSIAELLGHFSSQTIRLVSNLILSRLLFPEAYGMTALVGVFIYAIVMLTDVGIRTAVTRSPRGDDPAFLDTAWTLNLIRCLGLFGVTCLLAWPLAWLYHKPVVAPLIAVSGLAFVIQGFESTVLLTFSRQVKRDKLVMLEISSQLVSTAVMIVWAKVSPSVWALAAGGLVNALCTTVGSHLLRRRKPRFMIEREAAIELRSFGKWVIGSSAFTLAAQQGDRLLLGYFLDLATLGVYSIAAMLAGAVGAVGQRLTGSVVFGVLSVTSRERPAELRRIYYSARLRLDLLCLAPLGALAVFGPSLVSILYDQRYQESGWMLQILCVRTALSCVSGPASAILIARGEPRQTMFGQGARFIVTWLAVPIGWHLFRLKGVLWGVTIAEIALLIPLWIACSKRGLFRFVRELVPFAAFAVGMVVAFLLRPLVTPLLAEAFAFLRRLKHGGG